MSTEVLYTDDTMLKDLTVGQLKDIIIETLSRGSLMNIETNRRQYTYSYTYNVDPKPVDPKPVYPSPCNEPYCGVISDKEV